MNQPNLLGALLDSWDRNNTILLNLLSAVPEFALEARAAVDSPSIAEMFIHIHYVRMVFVSEDVPEFASEILYKEWMKERDPRRIAHLLIQSAQSVRDAVRHAVQTPVPMARHYDHPVLFLQHMIWHEGYHHGQIKLALKLTGHPMPDDQAAPLTWGVWMRKTAHP
jgi:uncharacterized damage-inducible protein DinB